MLADEDAYGDARADQIRAAETVGPAGFVACEVFSDGLLDGGEFIGDFGFRAVERVQNSSSVSETRLADEVPRGFRGKGEAGGQDDWKLHFSMFLSTVSLLLMRNVVHLPTKIS